MAEYIIKINDETKEISFTIDGKEKSAKDVNLSSYCYCDYNDKEINSASVSYGMEDKKTGDRVTKCISFGNNSHSESESTYSIAKQVVKSVANLHATASLEKALGKLNKN